MNLLAAPDLIERLAAAYALGTLRGGARRRFEAVARQSPAVKAQVIIWQERFAAMTELQTAQAPDPNVWKRIENSLHAQQDNMRTRPTPPAQPAVLERLGRLVALWRGVALASGAVALVVAVIGGQLSASLDREKATLADVSRQRDDMSRKAAETAAQMQAMPQIQYVAVLADQRAAPMLLATFDPKHNTLTLKRMAPMPGPDRSLQLWALPPGAPPRSLGVLGDAPVLRLPMPQLPMQDMPALAVSLEPRGGAPQGSGPTGPVMYQGALLQTAL